MLRSLTLAAVAALALSACDSNGPSTEVDLQVQVAADVIADPANGRDPNTGRPTDSGRYTLYSLADNEVVLSYAETDPAVRQRDSASTRWDIGFQGTTIVVNGGDSGPGAGAGLIVEEAFADVATAAGLALRVDGQASCPSGPGLAVCTGGGNGWYTYVPAQNLILPTPGRTLVVRTADGDGYAKINFRSYYQGSPAEADITPTTPSRYYSFEYVLNTEGQAFVEAD